MTSLARVAAALVAISLLSCSPQTSATVQGIVTAVDGDLSQVTGFTVLVEGEPMSFVPSEDGDYAFPLSHLREHLRTGEPVLVGWQMEGGERVATFLDDA